VQPTASLLLPRERHTVRAARALLESTLESAGATPDDVADLAVALSEACSNAVRHANGARCYRVEIALEAGGCTVVVSDDGAGFQPGAVPMPAPVAEGGRGLALMDALVDRFEIHADPGCGSRVVLFKCLSHRRRSSFPPSARGYGHSNTTSQPIQEAQHG
jgi:serine/threonine-protein kinase RsbW